MNDKNDNKINAAADLIKSGLDKLGVNYLTDKHERTTVFHIELTDKEDDTLLFVEIFGFYDVIAFSLIYPLDFKCEDSSQAANMLMALDKANREFSTNGCFYIHPVYHVPTYRCEVLLMEDWSEAESLKELYEKTFRYVYLASIGTALKAGGLIMQHMSDTVGVKDTDILLGLNGNQNTTNYKGRGGRFS